MWDNDANAAAASGAALWAGLALGTGWVLRDEVRITIALLDAVCEVYGDKR